MKLQEIVFPDSAGTAYMVPLTTERAIVSPFRRARILRLRSGCGKCVARSGRSKRDCVLQFTYANVDDERRRELVWTGERAGHRWHVLGMPGHGNRDVPCPGDFADRRIESLPSWTREINLRPGVSRCVAGLGRWRVQVTAHEAAGEAEVAAGLDEQRSVIAARATALGEG